MKRQSCIILLGLLLGSACAPEKQVEYAEDPTSATPETTSATRRLFQFQGKLNSNAGSLNLSSASTFEMTLSGCASTQTATVTQADTYIEVYEFDRNCVVKLTKFELNGKLYTPKAGSGFNTWAAADTAVFEHVAAGATPPVDELNLKVLTTVASPVVANGAVEYEYSEIVAGADTLVDEATVRESATVKVGGSDAPNFRINKITLVNITGTGNGEFRFQMDCNQNVTVPVAGDATSMQCYDVRLADIKMALVENTYTGNLNKSQLNAIMSAAPGGGRIIDLATNTIAVGGGSPVVAHGGFVTGATGQPGVMVMAGTKPIESHPNMIFVINAGPSYQYFKVDVQVIVQGP